MVEPNKFTITCIDVDGLTKASQVNKTASIKYQVDNVRSYIHRYNRKCTYRLVNLVLKHHPVLYPSLSCLQTMCSQNVIKLMGK